MFKEPLERVEWVDSAGVSGWTRLDNDYQPEPLVIESYGRIIYEDDKCVTIAPHNGQETKHTARQFCGEMTIPKVCIMRRDIIDVPESQKGR